jgi:hypothetical protein
MLVVTSFYLTDFTTSVTTLTSSTNHFHHQQLAEAAAAEGVDGQEEALLQVQEEEALLQMVGQRLLEMEVEVEEAVAGMWQEVDM